MNCQRGASAQLNEWRTQVQVSVGQGTALQFSFDGGLNEASSFTTLATSGAAPQASASLDANGYIPTLRVKADASPTRSQAVAWGVQGYTNTSGSPLDTSLVLNLSASISGSNDLNARVYLFEDDNFEFSRDSGTILFESSSQLWPGFESFANNPGPGGFDVLIGNHDGLVNETRQFDFTVPPGDSFYVWAQLLGTADNIGLVDALSTLTASLTNTNGLVPATAAVPEPGTAMLLILGAAGLCLRRRGRSWTLSASRPKTSSCQEAGSGEMSAPLGKSSGTFRLPSASSVAT
jgi:hypothetical protein